MWRDNADVLMFARALARPKCSVSLSSTKWRNTVMFTRPSLQISGRNVAHMSIYETHVDR